MSVAGNQGETARAAHSPARMHRRYQDAQCQTAQVGQLIKEIKVIFYFRGLCQLANLPSPYQGTVAKTRWTAWPILAKPSRQPGIDGISEDRTG